MKATIFTSTRTKLPAILLHQFINWKAENPHLLKYGKLCFEYFVFDNRAEIEMFELTNIKALFPQYFTEQ